MCAHSRPPDHLIEPSINEHPQYWDSQKKRNETEKMPQTESNEREKRCR
jgi:hypothetical protein